MCLQERILKLAGVRLSKTKQSVFAYDPAKLGTGLNFALAWMVLPSIFPRMLLVQFVILAGLTHLWFVYTPPANSLNNIMHAIYEHMEKFTPFLLGLFLSLMISKTYYTNRGFFGTLFGRSLGFAQMTTAWIRGPTEDKQEAAHRARQLLVRWANAAFRLMWLECREGFSVDQIGQDMLNSTLLTEREWEHVKQLPSRCTHIYQWMNNVLLDLYREGFICSDVLLKQMHQQIEDMRAANVWGLPSLPLPYTLLIVMMVKLHLLAMALDNGAGLNKFKAKGMTPTFYCWLGCHINLFLSNFLYQGLLDLHGHLFNPNKGDLLGHMPSVNFLDFVKTVSTNLLEQNEAVPYDLELGPTATASSNTDVSNGPSGPVSPSPAQIEMTDASHMRRPLLAS